MEWMIYFVTRLDSLNGFLVGMVIVGIIASGIGTLISTIQYIDRQKWKKKENWCEEEELFYQKAVKWTKGLFVIWISLSFLNILIPSTKEALAIWTVPQALESNSMQKIPDLIEKALGIADKKLDELVKEEIK